MIERSDASPSEVTCKECGAATQIASAQMTGRPDDRCKGPRQKRSMVPEHALGSFRGHSPNCRHTVAEVLTPQPDRIAAAQAGIEQDAKPNALLRPYGPLRFVSALI
jgi:hypothetical protein